MITASYNTAKDIDNPDELLRTLDEAVSIMDQVSGLDPADRTRSTDRVSTASTCARLHSVICTCTSTTGYESRAMRQVLNAYNVRHDYLSYGWGPWHEFGHTYQQNLWNGRCRRSHGQHLLP